MVAGHGLTASQVLIAIQTQRGRLSYVMRQAETQRILLKAQDFGLIDSELTWQPKMHALIEDELRGL